MDSGRGIVLVGVLKRKRDLTILLRERWYRIPRAWFPKRKFQYLAFYQPALFGRQGKRIQYYARVMRCETHKRRGLLPRESVHPNADAEYAQIHVADIKKLPKAIINRRPGQPRRVSFGFTTFTCLKTARNILELYRVAPTEEMMGKALVESGIRAIPQHYVSSGLKRRKKLYCLDFAILCKWGAIAIECDNRKAHVGARQRAKDGTKDAFLRRRGWTVVRLKEEEIVLRLEDCITHIRKTIQALGGQS
ncbi:MAG: DUF559 domain-containing protein [Candidatus Liptonbacteria bacterium]|nr:DUF559 domain-containing protein [Candidatus Liptonbacteria bacterium]